jgi:hemerythrin-like domain-containing protein
MIDIDRLRLQHREIFDSVEYIEDFIESGNYESNLDTLAEEINVLAGKLKIHLSVEDVFLYPDLMENGSMKAKEIVNNFKYEMTSLNSIFIDYKNQFNTKDKISNNIEGFIRISKEVFEILRMRIGKEEKELYNLIP